MHPILARRGRLGLYLAAWIPGSGLLAILVATSGQVSWLEASALTLPLSLIYAFICLASWYPCRAMPAGRARLVPLIGTHALAALLSSSVWLLIGTGWARILSQAPQLSGVGGDFSDTFPIFLAVGVLLYLLAAAAHYLLAAFEASREAESRSLELQVRAREAELRALEAQREQELAERELGVARSIQQRLLPPPEVEGDGNRLAARNLPARYVAGDFYDVFPLPDGALAIAVADVAGKGLGASLIMAAVKAVLSLVAVDSSVVETLRRLNRKLTADLGAREFVALAYARYTPLDGRLELANAGLPDPYLLRRGRAPVTVEVPGPRLPLGMREVVDYRSVEILLEPTDRLLLLTDGLPEACTSSGEPLGYEALAELIHDHHEGAPSRWLDGLLERLQEETVQPPGDDLTALLLERTPTPVRRDP